MFAQNVVRQSIRVYGALRTVDEQVKAIFVSYTFNAAQHGLKKLTADLAQNQAEGIRSPAGETTRGSLRRIIQFADCVPDFSCRRFSNRTSAIHNTTHGCN